MKLRIRIISLILSVLAIAGCKSSLQIISDYDKNADFKAYKTYMLLPWRPDNSKLVSAPTKRYLYAALEHEMNARGYSKVESGADLAVNLMVIIEEKSAQTAYQSYYQYGGWGYYAPFGYGYSSVRYDSYEYLQGTVIVDVFDQKEKKLVWQGAAIAEIKEDKKDREQGINKGMAKVFMEYPVKKQ
jgi:hypothetical protein